jgi:hypothetical protein
MNTNGETQLSRIHIGTHPSTTCDFWFDPTEDKFYIRKDAGWLQLNGSTGGAYIPLSDATTTPTADKIPIADGSGKLDAGWLPAATLPAEALVGVTGKTWNCYAGVTDLSLLASSVVADGDLIVMYPGVHDMGGAKIRVAVSHLNIFCFPGVTISSDESSSTIQVDAGCELVLHGFPTIINTNGLDKRIVRADSTAIVTGFWWEIDGFVKQSGSSDPEFEYTIDRLGGHPAWHYQTDGEFSMELNGAFSGLVSFTPIVYHDVDADQTCSIEPCGDFTPTIDAVYFQIYSLDDKSLKAGINNFDWFGKGLRFNLRVYP